MVAGAVALLLGCALDDWVSDYAGTDLIADRGLSLDSFAPAFQGGATPAYEGYVAFAEITDSAVYGNATGLPDNPGPIYRLELPNLLRNGDFEETTVGDPPDEWTEDGGVLVADDSAGLAISGKSGSFEIGGSNRVYVDLKAQLHDGLIDHGQYHVNFLVRRGADNTLLTFDYGSDTQSGIALDQAPWISLVEDSPQLVEEFPNNADLDFTNKFAVKEFGVHRFYIGNATGSASTANGYVDNVRIGRADILPHVALRLGPATQEDSLDIIPGRYRFSVYVKSELDSQVTPETPNAYRSAQIMLGINDLWGQSISAEEGAWSTTEWKRVSFECPPIQTDELAGEWPLTLRMTVSSNDNPMVGRILVAAPTLELVSSR